MILILGNILTHTILILGNIYWLLGNAFSVTQNRHFGAVFCSYCSFQREVYARKPTTAGLLSFSLSLLFQTDESITFLSEVFGISRRLPRSATKCTKKECFEGVVLHHKAHPIYPDISDPIISRHKVISYWADAALILPNNQYYPDTGGYV